MNDKILVIDDHYETVRLIEMTLRRDGYEVLGAQSGREGLRMAEEERPDLILLDVMMPDMDGYEVCNALRAHDELSDTPIIMFTAMVQPEDKRMGFELGANDYLTKPTRPGELKERVAALLERVAEDRPDTKTTAEPPSPTSPPPASPEGDDSEIIVVLGARGGAGATTVAINLAAALAGQGHPTTLVDLDVTQGHVAIYLNREVEQGVMDLLQLPPDALSAQMASFTVDLEDNWVLLPARPHLDGKDVTAEQVRGFVGVLRHPGRVVVVDAGGGVGENIRPLLEAADQIIVCLKPERAAVLFAKGLLTHLSGIGDDDQRLHALMLNLDMSVSLPRPAVEAFLDFSLLDVITISGQALARMVNEGVPLVQLYPDTELDRHFQQLARQMAPA